VPSKPLLVAQREYLENVRTKTFWIGILSFPLILGLMFLIGWLLRGAKEVKHYAVLDHSGAGLARAVELQARSADLGRLVGLLGQQDAPQQLLRPFAAAFAALPSADQEAARKAAADQNGDLPANVGASLLQRMQEMSAEDLAAFVQQTKALETMLRYRRRSLESLGLADQDREQQQKRCNELVERGELFAYFVFGENAATDLRDCKYVSTNRTDDELRRWYANAASQVFQRKRIAEAGIAPEVAARIQERVTFREEKPGEGGKTEEVQVGEKMNKFAPVGFVYLLWIAVFTAAQMLLTNTVEEKSNRIIEVLLSSVSPLQLMSGKIWGIAATGLTIVGSWVAFALLGVWIAPQLIPELADFPLMAVIGDPLYLLSFVGYFLGGYLLYAAILVGIGSVCNSLKEAQNLLQPVFIVLIVPLVSMVFITQEPNGTVARILTYIPLFTPFTMMNRAGGPPPAWEYVVSGLVILVSVWLAFRAAGKVFRVGILMTGKPPRLKEMLSWLRQA
jgi:ABC-2 type transport system permease protein